MRATMMLSRTPPRRRRELWSGRARRGLRRGGLFFVYHAAKSIDKTESAKISDCFVVPITRETLAASAAKSLKLRVSGPRAFSSISSLLHRSRRAAPQSSPARRSRGRPPVADIEAGHGVDAHRFRRRRRVCGARHRGAPSRRRWRARVLVRCEPRRFAVARREPRPTRHRPRRRPRVARRGDRARGETRGARRPRGRACLGEPRRGAQAGTDPSLQRLPPWPKISPTWRAFALFREVGASTL